MVEYTAQGGGYFKVYKDDVYVSQHTAEREALEKAVNLTREYPESEIRVRHDSYNVLVEDDIQIPPEPLPSDLPAPVITSAEAFEDRIEVSHTHEGDYDNVEYAIKTRAYLDDKVSPFSNEVMVMGIGENVGENVGEEDSSNTFLPTPTNCQITDTQITTVSLSWDMPQNVGNTTSFLLIARGVSPVTYDTVTVSNKLATSGTITGLTQGSQYNCSVAAVSALDVAGTESNVVNTTTVSSYAPIWQSFTLPTVTVGSGWSTDLNNYVDASGGAITSFSVSSGVLPNGITLDAGAAGTFSGTASSQDSNTVYFTATNAAGSDTTVAQAWTVSAAGSSLIDQLIVSEGLTQVVDDNFEYTDIADAINNGPWRASEGSIEISTDVAHSGSKSLKVSYGGANNVHLEMAIGPNEVAADCDIIAHEWWEYRPTDHDWGAEKFNRYYGRQVTSDVGTDLSYDYPMGWGVTGGDTAGTDNVVSNTFIQFFGNSAYTNGQNYFTITPSPFTTGSWHKFQFYIDLGTYGVSDARAVLTIDDTTVADATGILLRPTTEQAPPHDPIPEEHLSYIRFGGWRSANFPPNPYPALRYMDDCKVWYK